MVTNIKAAMRLRDDLDRAIAFAVFDRFHVFDDETEVAHFKCPTCGSEFTFDKATDEKPVIAKLVDHLGTHLDHKD